MGLSQVLHHHNERNQAVRLQANVLFVLVAVEQMRRCRLGPREAHNRLARWESGEESRLYAGGVRTYTHTYRVT